MPTDQKDTGPEGQNTAHPASKDPLHGVTLEMMLNQLVAFYGWEEMGRTIRIRCFTHKPSISSSLAFLRRTSWARKKVEDWYRVTRARSSQDASHQRGAASDLCTQGEERFSVGKSPAM